MASEAISEFQCKLFYGICTLRLISLATAYSYYSTLPNLKYHSTPLVVQPTPYWSHYVLTPAFSCANDVTFTQFVQLNNHHVHLIDENNIFMF